LAGTFWKACSVQVLLGAAHVLKEIFAFQDGFEKAGQHDSHEVYMTVEKKKRYCVSTTKTGL